MYFNSSSSIVVTHPHLQFLELIPPSFIPLSQPLMLTEEFGVNEPHVPTGEEVPASMTNDNCMLVTSSCTESPNAIQKMRVQLFHRDGSKTETIVCPTWWSDSDGSQVSAFDTGDLQGTINYLSREHQAQSPLSSDYIALIEGISSKACRYSPEEKRERIERYRSKRSQRNFNKKIKYECRKALADTRPRIKGRFARKEQLISSSPQNQWTDKQIEGEEDLEYEDTWINLLDDFSNHLST
ncbi:hypothetical protein Dimus_009059 [Dionaea muscipula]